MISFSWTTKKSEKGSLACITEIVGRLNKAYFSLYNDIASRLFVLLDTWRLMLHVSYLMYYTNARSENDNDNEHSMMLSKGDGFVLASKCRIHIYRMCSQWWHFLCQCTYWRFISHEGRAYVWTTPLYCNSVMWFITAGTTIVYLSSSHCIIAWHETSAIMMSHSRYIIMQSWMWINHFTTAWQSSKWYSQTILGTKCLVKGCSLTHACMQHAYLLHAWTYLV